MKTKTMWSSLILFFCALLASEAMACVLEAQVTVVNIGNAPFPQLGVTIVETENDKRAENVGDVYPTYSSQVDYGQVYPQYGTIPNGVTNNIAIITHQSDGGSLFAGDHTASFKIFRNGSLLSSYANWTKPATYTPITICHINVNTASQELLTAVAGIGSATAGDIATKRSLVPFINYTDFVTRVQDVEGNGCLMGWIPATGVLVTTNAVTKIYHTTGDMTPDCGHLPTTNGVTIYNETQAISLGYTKCYFCD